MPSGRGYKDIPSSCGQLYIYICIALVGESGRHLRGTPLGTHPLNLGTSLGTRPLNLGTPLGCRLPNLGTPLGSHPLNLGTHSLNLGTTSGTHPLNLGTPLGTHPLSLVTTLGGPPLNLGTPLGTLGSHPLNLVTPLGTHPLNLGTPLGTLPLNLGTPFGSPPLDLGTTRRQTLKNFQVHAPANWLGEPPTGSPPKLRPCLRGSLPRVWHPIRGRLLNLGTTLAPLPPEHRDHVASRILENFQVRATTNWLGAFFHLPHSVWCPTQ